MGSAGQFVYDLGCIVSARNKHFDVWLILGYTSSSVWGWLYPKKIVSISNMDGLEWKRSKYNSLVKQFLLFAEKLATRYSDFLIADSSAIQSYLLNKYRIKSEYIAYGADIHRDEDEGAITEYGITKYNYYLVIARMEPENNIEMILDGFCKSNPVKSMLIIGDTKNEFGKYLVERFTNNKLILFIGSVYDANKLNTLKLFCSLYLHGHSCGGTNPSLLEAMASRALICAHDNLFNKAILGNDAFYFSSANDIKEKMEELSYGDVEKTMVANNLKKITEQYNWPRIVSEYERYIINCYNTARK